MKEALESVVAIAALCFLWRISDLLAAIAKDVKALASKS
jgi:hypothetical protein